VESIDKKSIAVIGMDHKDKSLPYVLTFVELLFRLDSAAGVSTGSIYPLPSYDEWKASCHHCRQIPSELNVLSFQVAIKLRLLVSSQDIISSASRFDNADQQDAHDFL